jgi:SSS family solute:Na+ symporter
MWTDAIQCVLLIGGGVNLHFVALAKIPGVGPAMVAATPERFHLYRPPSDAEAPFLGLICASFGVFLFYQSINQVMIQRVLSARSTRDGMLGIVFAGFISLARPLVTSLLGLSVYHWLDVLHRGPSLLPDRQDQAFPYALAVFAPSGIRGVILAGFVAAVMSAMSALANALATIFSLDIYHRFLRKQASEAELIATGRIAAGAALVVAALIAPSIATVGLFRYFQTGITYMATPFISVVLLAIPWQRTSYAGAIAGLLGGLAIQVALAAILRAGGITLHWLYVGAIAQVFTMLLIVLVSLLTMPPTPEQYAPFLWRPSCLATYKSGDSLLPWWQQQRFWFAAYALAWIYVYRRFW